MNRFEFRLPDLGEGLVRAKFVEWFIDEGEEVEEDAPLCEVETDKALVEIPAPCAGTLIERRAAADEVVHIDDVIAVFDAEDQPRRHGGVEADAASGAETIDGGDAGTRTGSESVDRTDESGSTNAERVFAAPSARSYARSRDVDLGSVDGSGPSGTVLRSDIDRYIERRDGTPDDGRSRPDAEGRTERSTTEERAANRTVRRPLRGLRRTIAENVAQSKREIPHVTAGFEADAEEFVALHRRLNEEYDDRISHTAMLTKAAVHALEEFPVMNASIDMEAGEILEHRHFDIGIATHTEDGLLVPVVDAVDRKSIVELSSEIEALVEEACRRELDRSQLTGSTFTISNVGSHSTYGTFGTPIINYPEAAILSVGRIDDEPVAVSRDELEIRKRVRFSLSYDHRLVDGVTAEKFVESFVENLSEMDVLG